MTLIIFKNCCLDNLSVIRLPMNAPINIDGINRSASENKLSEKYTPAVVNRMTRKTVLHPINVV